MVDVQEAYFTALRVSGSSFASLTADARVSSLLRSAQQLRCVLSAYSAPNSLRATLNVK